MTIPCMSGQESMYNGVGVSLLGRDGAERETRDAVRERHRGTERSARHGILLGNAIIMRLKARRQRRSEQNISRPVFLLATLGSERPRHMPEQKQRSAASRESG